jgi:UDP-N-acetylmuramate--alanine ligase
VRVFVGHEAAHLEDPDWVTASPAVPTSNPELAAAGAAGVPVYSRAVALGALTRLRRTLAVAGTHGKTTTSSMLALIALEAGAAPSFLIGAELASLGANARWGEGDLLVLEADESYGSFAELVPSVVGITNVEADHLDFYGTVENLEAAFVDLVERAEEGAVALADDPGAARVAAATTARRIGVTPGVELLLDEVELGRAYSAFRLQLRGGPLSLRVGAAGLHNVRNAAVAAAMADAVGLAPEAIQAGLARFTGVPRRYEFRGEAAGVTFIDDYAHLPAEVAATLAAAAAGGFERIVAVFQPHRFTRTQAVAASFAGAFDLADLLVVTDVFASGETPIPGVTGRLVADAAAQGRRDLALRYVPDVASVVELLVVELRPGDLCLTMGAGDLTELPDQVLGRLR